MLYVVVCGAGFLRDAQNCEICRAGDDDLHMLLCDGCDRGSLSDRP